MVSTLKHCGSGQAGPSPTRSAIVTSALFLSLMAASSVAAQDTSPDGPASGCLKCHAGIEPIRQPDSLMMQAILEEGEQRGDPAGCVVCHGGDAAAEEKEIAHGGNAFYPDPGSPWVNEKTCKACHPEHVRVQERSLMMTEAGKIQGTVWAFGAMTGYEHKWGNYRVDKLPVGTKSLGTDAYRAYMKALRADEPNVFVEAHEALPDAPRDLSRLAEHPEEAAFTYLRNQCLRCHLGVKGRQERGDYRGMGCSACHIPYGNEGFYEGGDPSIPHDQPGHLLVHSMQGTRDAKVKVHGHEYSGIPVETCTTCHDRGKRIGVSFQGLMESAYSSPFAEDGQGQPALHTKHYVAMHQDIHYQKGMTCQDCHTSIDVHGDGCLAAATLAAVQIECADCHGTPDAYPWELPLGFGDEFFRDLDQAPPLKAPNRGTTKNLTSHVKAGMVYPVQDGYLLTARGNPLTNAVRTGNRVIVHTAAGKDITLSPLKLLADQKKLSLRGRVAMQSVRGHVQKMECYTCHTSWAPQCYGCHVKIDYTAGTTSFDWLAAGRRHDEQDDCARDRGESGYDTTMPGSVTEGRSYLRFEDPPMGVNGEGRISPVAPGCQVSVTVIGEDGKSVLLNHIFRTPAGTEGGGAAGQLSLDMSPLQPHTMTKNARTCDSCHASDKSLGYGIGAGELTRPWDRRVVVDLRTADGHILPKNHVTQIEPIDGLTADWSRFVTEDGEQLQTVGHHFQRSRPLNDEERSHVDRRGVCLTCHQEIPEGSLAVSLLHHVASFTGQIPKTRSAHDSLIRNKILLLSAWGQVLMAGGLSLAGLVGVLWLRRRRRRARL